MNEYLRLKKSNCKNCYKCIRQCPVKSIKFQNNQAHIIEDECILCGQCFVVCPQNAKEIRNDTGAVRELIASAARSTPASRPRSWPIIPAPPSPGWKRRCARWALPVPRRRRVGRDDGQDRLRRDVRARRRRRHHLLLLPHGQPAHPQIFPAGHRLSGAGAFPDAGALQVAQGAPSRRGGGFHRPLHLEEGRSGAVSRRRRFRADL